MVIGSGNENNTHFPVTRETEGMALATRQLRLICFGQQVNQIYLRVKIFKKQSRSSAVCHGLV